MTTPDIASPPRIAVIVLNWNGADDTIECLASLRQSTAPVCAIVVDNGSAGDDVARIRATGFADVILETGRNLGYAGGNNVGLGWALDEGRGFDVVAVLNNDTVVDPACFAALSRQVCDTGPSQREKAVTPLIRYYAEPEAVWFEGGVVDRGWPRHLQPSERSPGDVGPRRTEWLVGCCIVARSETWREVGLFDPAYFLIFEDCDWSLRARALGVELIVDPSGEILHKVSQSFGSGQASLLGSFYFMRNLLLFAWRHARRHVLGVALRHLVRPTASAAAGRRLPRHLVFRWAGAGAFLLGQRGVAPPPVQRLARKGSAEAPA